MIKALAMPLPSMTTRRWMIAVAVAGLCCAGVVGISRLRERRQRFQALAGGFRQKAAICALIESGSRQSAASFVQPTRSTLEGYLGLGEVRPPTENGFAALLRQHEAAAKKYRVLARYYAQLSRKYDVAARRPWLPVPPDPPPPE